MKDGWGGYGVREKIPIYNLFNSTVYLEILENVMLPSVWSLNLLDKISLLHNNFAIHKSKLIQKNG